MLSLFCGRFRTRIAAVKADCKKSPRTLMRSPAVVCEVVWDDNDTSIPPWCIQNCLGWSFIWFGGSCSGSRKSCCIISSKVHVVLKDRSIWKENPLLGGDRCQDCPDAPWWDTAFRLLRLLAVFLSTLYIEKETLARITTRQITNRKHCEPQASCIQIFWLVLRQRSQLAMNRRIQWSQSPPNLDDYSPECLQSGALGPLQQAPPDDTAATGSQKRGGGPLHPNVSKAPKTEQTEGLVLKILFVLLGYVGAAEL